MGLSGLGRGRLAEDRGLGDVPLRTYVDRPIKIVGYLHLKRHADSAIKVNDGRL